MKDTSEEVEGRRSQLDEERVGKAVLEAIVNDRHAGFVDDLYPEISSDEESLAPTMGENKATEDEDSDINSIDRKDEHKKHTYSERNYKDNIKVWSSTKSDTASSSTRVQWKHIQEALEGNTRWAWNCTNWF